MYENNKTIKDKLPICWQSGDPIYYCEDDDTLWTSQAEVSIHRYDIKIINTMKLIIKAQNEASEHLYAMNKCKRMYPVYQKEIDRINKRLKVLLTTRDWRETNDSHAAKRREVVTLQYKRYEWLDKLRNEKRVFAEKKLAYKLDKKVIDNLEKTLKDYKDRRESKIERLKNKEHESEKNNVR